MGSVVLILLVLSGIGAYFMSLRWQRADEQKEAEAQLEADAQRAAEALDPEAQDRPQY